jgi:hypothetical protein
MGSLTDMAYGLGNALGFPDSTAAYTGGMILSAAILIMVVMAMSSLMGRSRNGEAGMIATAGVTVTTMGMLFVIGWMPFVFLIVSVIFVGVMVATKVRDGLT